MPTVRSDGNPAHRSASLLAGDRQPAPEVFLVDLQQGIQIFELRITPLRWVTVCRYAMRFTS